MNASSREQPHDPVLLRQLKRLGASDTSPPDLGTWERLLSALSDHYRRSAEDRAMLTRSMDLASSEFEVLRTKVEKQRDSFRDTIVALSEALSVFGDAVRTRDAKEETGITSIEAAKADFSARLYRIFDAERDASATAEISGLSVSLVKLADQLTRLLDSSAARAAGKKDLEVARAAQRLLVPPHASIDGAALRVTSTFRPAAECGGDLWLARDLPDGTTLVLVGDVTGHGVAAAILAGVVKGACEAALRDAAGFSSPRALLARLDEVVRECARGEALMTFTAALVDAGRSQVTIANAGHPHTLWLRPGEAKPLVVDGPPLGAGGPVEHREMTFRVDRGDSLVWYTDGLVERENDQGEPFGERRLRAVCQRAALGGAESILALVESTFDTFASPSPDDDDVTLVVGTVK
jgi:sigma-B regulation protein RsbU (phosphoserine phosphatase)